ncbi:transposase [Marinobacter adhaerens]|uniref:Transposase n=1 Tax=Marinobacter adhaerens TaxID=1033846 RepID=A0A851HXE0_9GAMM|nr:transposase [Marinobacter adhaerens]NWN91625.1 transposase [Marinobacter adhaerens]
MNNLSVTKPYQRRRRFSREFKADIVSQCQEPGASVSRISLDNGLNANMVRRWISEARHAEKAAPKTPGFVPVNLPATPSVSGSPAVPDKRSTIRIEIPRADGSVVVEWPAEQAHQCAALLRDLLG